MRTTQKVIRIKKTQKGKLLKLAPCLTMSQITVRLMSIHYFENMRNFLTKTVFDCLNYQDNCQNT